MVRTINLFQQSRLRNLLRHRKPSRPKFASDTDARERDTHLETTASAKIRRRLRRAMLFAMASPAVAAAALILHAIRVPTRQLSTEAVTIEGVDDRAVAQVLTELLAEPTISDRDPALIDPKPFHNIHAILREKFPRTHASLECKTVNELSLLYC